MKCLSKYHNTTVRIICKNGDTFAGACEYCPSELNLHEYGIEEECLQIGDDVFFVNDILEIELPSPRKNHLATNER